MRVLLLGATGFLGDHLATRLSRSYLTCAPAPRTARVPRRETGVSWLHHGLDATDEATIDPVLTEASPDVIVNAIADTRTSGEGEHKLRVVNTEFPRTLASRAEVHHARVIHISTDAVFSGARGRYTETDRPDPVDVYGRSKLDGELGPPHTTIRTTFFGRTSRGTGLVEWLLANRGDTIDGFVDYRFSGIAVTLLAEFIALAIGSSTPLEGVYHVGGESVTKYQLLTEAATCFGLRVCIVPVRRGAVDRTLESRRFFAAIRRTPPTLAESLATFAPRGTA